ncbi:MAG: M56 family metallopeptidase [Prevotella sp.]|nr:M56 family metallopeptidase [Prevotella sp.]
MMIPFFTYELKVAVLIAAFYIFWRLLVANETWHRLNRIVLLSTAVASFVLPLCVITIHQTVEVMPTVADTLPLPTEEKAMPMESAPAVTNAETVQSFNWQLPLTIIYIIGVLTVLSKMLLSLWRLYKMMAESEIHPLSDGYRIAICKKAKTPFSWWKTVFLNHQDFEEGTTALLTHELGHLRLHHSADVLLVELLTALQWFNPAMWMLRADLRTIHEYEADQQVISHGFNDIQYLQLLIRKAAGQSGYSLANGISNSALKKRVTMVMKPKTSHWQWLRFTYLLPIIAVSLYASCKIKTDYQTKEESAIILKANDGKDCFAVKAPVGAFYSWIVNGKLAERGVVEEDGRWNVYTSSPIDECAFTLDGKDISKDDIPYVPLSSIKELKFIQGEQPRRIELYTSYVSGFQRDNVPQWSEEYKEKTKAWMFFRVEDAATGRQIKGAEVSIEGTDQKALTNNEGWCEMKVPLGAKVKASYKGLESQTLAIDHQSGSQVQGRSFLLYKPGHPIYQTYQLSREQEPVFPGDKEKWIAEHIQLPDMIKKDGFLGSVTVGLVINEDGTVSGVRLHQGIRRELNEEALRVVGAMPRWKPAKKDGKPVKCLMLIRVSFKNV